MTAIYLNSTPGVLTLLGGRDNRKPSYPSFSLDTLRSLPVPDFRAVDSERMTLLGRAFDQLQDKTLQPSPTETPVVERLSPERFEIVS